MTRAGPSLDLQMRSVLGALETLSHGTTQSWNPSRAGDSDSKLLAHDQARVPDPPHVYWRRRYEDAGFRDLEAENSTGVETFRSRERAYNGAVVELKAWRGWGRDAKKDLPSDAEILRERILEAEGWSVAEVALRLRCTETMVRKVRLANDLMVQDGKMVAPIADHVDDRERVAQLAERGLTERQIVLLTKLPKTTIRRILRRAA